MARKKISQLPLDNAVIGTDVVPIVSDGATKRVQLSTLGTYFATVVGGGQPAWSDITGKPSTFTPSAHTHSSSDVTDFTSAAAAAAPVQSVNGQTGAVTISAGVTSVNGQTGAVTISVFSGSYNDLTNKPTTLSGYGITDGVASNDSRLTDSREWSADTVSQAEAEAGTATTRRAFTALRVFQSISAWWAGSTAKTKLDGIATGATANATDAQLRDRSTHTGTQLLATISDAGTAASRSAPASGNAGSTEVVLGSDTRLTDARTPTAHKTSHATGGSDALTAADIGAAAASHSHAASDTTSGTFDIARIPTGTSSTTVCIGNDSRLSDTRTPTDGTVTTAKVADDAVTYAKIQNVSATDKLLGRSSAGAGDIEEIACTAAGRAILDDADAAAQRTTLGAVSSSDSRLTDARTPTAHASSHASGGSDALSLAASQITSGVLATARLGTGTADSTTFLRGDGTFAVPSGGGAVSYATTAQALDLSSTSVAMNPANVRSMLTGWLRLELPQAYGLSGGVTDYLAWPSAVSVVASSTANSAAVRYRSAGFGTSTKRTDRFDWSVPRTLYCIAYRNYCPSTAIFRYLFGSLASGGFAWETLSNAGFGFEIRAARIWIIAHNGTTLTQADTGIDATTSDYTGLISNILLRSDGAGNVTLTHALGFGSASTYTTTGGPSAQSSATPTAYIGVNNGGTASAASFSASPHLINIL